MLARFGDGKPFWKGGRDHSSHRLVYRGLSEWRAVAVLLAVTACCAATAIVLVIVQNVVLTAVVSATTVVVLAALAARLAAVTRDGTPPAPDPAPLKAAGARLPSDA
jgi:UDP-GlcNAc:undecaprenyl-phosphate GlcNAc-1-phosphate transferase